MVHAGLAPKWTTQLAEKRPRDRGKAARRQRVPQVAEEHVWRRPRLVAAAQRQRTRPRDHQHLHPHALLQPARAHRLRHKGEPGSQPPGLYPWYSVPGHAARDLKVVCGHWSTLGLFVGHGVHAIDTGAVWGGKLTALQLDAEGLRGAGARPRRPRPPPKKPGRARTTVAATRTGARRRRRRSGAHVVHEGERVGVRRIGGCATRATSRQSAASKRGNRHRPGRPWCPPGEVQLRGPRQPAHTPRRRRSRTVRRPRPPPARSPRPMKPPPACPANGTRPPRVSTRLRRFGSARPSDSAVLRPISTGLPRVSALKRLRSSGRCQGKHCRSRWRNCDPARRSATHACELPVSDRDRCLDRRPRVVAVDGDVPRTRKPKMSHVGIQPQPGHARGSRASSRAPARNGSIQVRVAQRVHEIADCQARRPARPCG